MKDVKVSDLTGQNFVGKLSLDYRCAFFSCISASLLQRVEDFTGYLVHISSWQKLPKDGIKSNILYILYVIVLLCGYISEMPFLVHLHLQP